MKNQKRTKTLRCLLAMMLCVMTLLCCACGGSGTTPAANGGTDQNNNGGNPNSAPAPIDQSVEADPAAIPALPGMGEYMSGRVANGGMFQNMNPAYASYLYTARGLFQNATVDHIDIYVSRVSAVDANQYITVHTADAHSGTIYNTYKFYARQKDLDSNAPKKVISLFPETPVLLGANETLMFGQSGDPIMWGYVQMDSGAPKNLRGFAVRSTFSQTSDSSILCVDVYLTDKVVEEQIDPAVKQKLAGKKLSIMGDSITTFSGWSNSTEVNTTQGSNVLYYPNGVVVDVNDTWWKQTVDITGMELLVNNAWAGSTVSSRTGEAGAGWNTRANNLHDNTLGNNPDNAPIDPDIIVVYLGINDSGNQVPCNGTFTEASWGKIEAEGFIPDVIMDDAYALMIYKIRKNYPDAVVFCFTLPDSKSGSGTALEPFNNTIRAVAEHYGCQLVDMNATALSEFYPMYTSDNLHPNHEGMDIMTETFIDALEAYYG